MRWPTPVVGAVLEALAASGRADSTLVLLISDHGPALPAGKTTLFDGGIRVPLLARWPSVIEPGRSTPALVSGVDILPTLMDAAGLPSDPELHGRSLMPLFTGERAEVREFVFAENTLSQGNRYFPQRAIRSARFKYVRNLRPDVEFRNNSMGWWIEPMLRRWDEDAHARFLLERIVRHPARGALRSGERSRRDDQSGRGSCARGKWSSGCGSVSGDGWGRRETAGSSCGSHEPGSADPFEPETTRDGRFEPLWLDAALDAVRAADR